MSAHPDLLIGDGYTGAYLQKYQAEHGYSVVSCRRSQGEWRWDCQNPWPHVEKCASAGIDKWRAVFVLCPPPDVEIVRDTQKNTQHARHLDEIPALYRQCWANIEAVAQNAPVICVISTAIYGDTQGQEVTEETIPNPQNSRELRWWYWEQAARSCTLSSLCFMHVPAIYGPKRAFIDDLRTQKAIALSDGPIVSRIHVADLAMLLGKMSIFLQENSHREEPHVFLACDEEPAMTRDVMTYAAQILQVAPPKLVEVKEAAKHFTPIGLQMRMSGRRCRSLRRGLTGGPMGWPLQFPTYRTGLPAAIAEELAQGTHQ